MIDEQVLHGSFGVGRIVDVETDIITIQFSDRIGQKKFQYPEAFEHFLKMCRPAAQEDIERELAILQKSIEVERLRRQELRLKEEQQRLVAKPVTKKKPTARKPKVSITKSKTAAKPTVDESTVAQNKK